MALQSAKNVTVAFKPESTFYDLPGDASAEFLRFTPSPGLQETAADIRSNEQRADALTTMGRSGSRQVSGSYGGECSLRSHDTLYEAVVRGTWSTELALTNATSNAPATITTEANAIVGADNSFITVGLRAGDVIRLSGFATAANNDRNLRVTAVTATRIETVETLVVDSNADAAYTITRGKKLVNPAAPVKRSFGVEQNNVDIAGSQFYSGVRFTGFSISGSPDGMATVEFSAIGAGLRTFTGSESPYFTTPTVYNSVPLVFADAKIAVRGSDVINITAFELSYAINAATEPVVGTVRSPDVFDNDASVEGSLTRIREDFDNVEDFVNETEFSLHVLLTEPVAEPKPYIAFYVPRCKYTDASAPLGGDGAMKESLPFQVGAQTASAGVDATMISICTSAAV